MPVHRVVNYDRSFEHYFTSVIAQRANVAEEEALELLQEIPLVHVHGSLGVYPRAGYGPELSPKSINRAANGILVVPEVEDTLPTFDAAYEQLRNAERIYFLGFGYNSDNVRRLRFLGDDWNEKPLTPLVAGTGIGIAQRALSAISQQILKGKMPMVYDGTVYNFLFHQTELD